MKITKEELADQIMYEISCLHSTKNNKVAFKSYLFDLGLSNLDRVELVLAIEDKLDIEIPPLDPRVSYTVWNIVDLVWEKLGKEKKNEI
jgi:acyl carrier protein